jgi:membrane-associated phospholipid phosphatase
VNIETRIARAVSYLFHPFLMPTYGMLLYFLVIEPNLMGRLHDKVKLVLALVTFIFTFLLPVISVIFLYRSGMISSLQMKTNRERIWPFLLTAGCYIGMYYVLPEERPEFNIIRALMSGAALSVILTIIINLFTKISAHMVGIGGISGAFIALSYYLQLPIHSIIFMLIFLAGVVGFARLALNAHTPGQVYAGFLTGLIVQVLVFLVPVIIPFIPWSFCLALTAILLMQWRARI